LPYQRFLARLFFYPLVVFGSALTKGLGYTSSCSSEVGFLFFLEDVGLF